MIEAEILEVWVSQSSEAKVPWKTFTPIRETKNGILVATSVNREMGIDSLECTWIDTSGKLGTPRAALSVVEMQTPRIAVAALLQTTIEGTGFHRRYVMDVELLDNNICGTGSSNKTILMRVPISSTTPSTDQVHIEFPLHFRYQAPSENKLYRQASVIAPDVFIFCPKEGRSVKRQLKLSNNDATHSYLHTWGLMGQPDPAIANHHWLHLSTSSPLPITQVSIPVGYLPSDWLVGSVTLLFASMGAALLCYVSVGASTRAPDHFASSWKGKTD
uniref:Phosphatidylinositol-glycan biosynthesis class X protein n=1 Tax=Hyaloperonospora arabidopsidis (strain Emoy2) TaxID=559515 RepID=M4BMF4_HYAAE